MAVLRELAEPKDAPNLDKLIWESGDTIQGLDARPRLRPRPRDADFFRKGVQRAGGLALLAAGFLAENDSQRRMAQNALRLREELLTWTPQRRFELARTIVTRTFLVVVTTSDLASAYRIFSVMNARGMELKPADIFKAKSDRVGARTAAEEVRGQVGGPRSRLRP